MRRGIATFGFVSRLAPVAFGIMLLAGYVALRPRAPFCECETPPPAPLQLSPPIPLSPAPLPLVVSPDAARKARGITLMPQDLTVAWLIDCRLVGDWRGKSLRSAMLADCDLSGAILDEAGQATGRHFAGGGPPVDLRGAIYDRRTIWPPGFEPRAHGATLMVE
jgi:hypothetical protein